MSNVTSRRFEFRLIEMDDEIVSLSGKNSIKEIFATDGEERFRSLENEVARELSDETEVIISTGGGAVFGKDNLEHFKANGGTIVFLDTSFEEVLARVGSDRTRPLLKNLEKARELYERRLGGYRRAADFVITTDGKSIEEVEARLV